MHGGLCSFGSKVQRKMANKDLLAHRDYSVILLLRVKIFIG
jgi:hypothetical protein